MFVKAATLVDTLRVASDADLGPMLEQPPAGTDPDVLRRLRHMYDTGGWVLLESAIVDLPADLRWLYESGAVTIEQLAKIHHALGATSAADLTTAVQQRALHALPGLGESVERAVAQVLPTLRARIPRIPLGRATAIAEPLLAQLRSTTGVEWASTVGSLRRGEDTVGDIELLAAASDPSVAIDSIVRLPEVVRILHRGARRVCLVQDRVQIGVRFPEPWSAGAALLHLTGSTAHVTALRSIADERGERLEPGGLFGADGTLQASASEDAIYAALDLPFIPPEIRDGAEEMAAAGRGGLPRLVTHADIRGDLHMHSTWSDGRDSIETMVATCRSLGYQYVAITDHSPTSAASRSLTVDGVTRQADEIAQLRGHFPELEILHGCEVDILPGGKLDFPDRILRLFDIVLASLHEGAGHSRDQLLRRYTDAMRHPLVTMITHPTNRIVPGRTGYDLDYDRLFETAAATGTVVEIDGAPTHLDMNGALARLAVAAGVTVSINSDCHRAEMLDRQMRLGITLARRGWVESRHVLNTRPLADIRALIARKRAG